MIKNNKELLINLSLLSSIIFIFCIGNVSAADHLQADLFTPEISSIDTVTADSPFYLFIPTIYNHNIKINDEIFSENTKVQPKDSVSSSLNLITMHTQALVNKTEKLNSLKANPVTKTKIKGDVLEKLEQKEKTNIIVKYKENTYSESSYELADLSEFKIMVGNVDVYTVEKLLNDPNVETIIQDKVYKETLASSIPSINADDVQASTSQGKILNGTNQTVCVIDNGIDYRHDDLGGCLGPSCKILAGIDYVHSDTYDYTDAETNHGTHVAGIVSGTAPGANIVNAKVCDNLGNCNGGYILQGLYWCYVNRNNFEPKISVVTMSVGSGDYTDATCPTDFDDAINSLVSEGIIVTMASGNGGSSTGIDSPACADNVIAVGSTNDGNTMSTFTDSYPGLLDLLAPGEAITSTINNNAYGSMQGTSMATPHVAGAAAIMKQYHEINSQTINNTEFLNLMQTTGTTVSARSNTWKRIDVLAAAQNKGWLDVKSNFNQNATNITNTGATITWESNFNSNSTVNYGTTTSLGTKVKNTTVTKDHKIYLTSLNQGITYYYNITSCDATDCVTSGPYSFTTTGTSRPSDNYDIDDEAWNLTGIKDIHDFGYDGYTLRGKGQSVCVISTGLDYTHDALRNCTGAGGPDWAARTCTKVLDGWDFWSPGQDPDEANMYFGTVIAGIIAADGKDRLGNGAYGSYFDYVGIAPDANILGVRVTDDNGGNWVNVDQGIEWCVNHSVQYNITTIVLGVYDDGQPGGVNLSSQGTCMYAAINTNLANDSFNYFGPTGDKGYTDGIGCLAAHPDVIAVGSVNDVDDSRGNYDNLSNFTNRVNDIPVLLAPGNDVDALDSGDTAGSGGLSTYFASAYAAGISMLFKDYYYQRYGYYPNATYVKEVMFNTGKNISDPLSNGVYPRVDLKAMLDYQSRPPAIFGVLNKSITNQSVTINWTTDENSNTTVNYGTTTGLGNIVGIDDSTTTHSITINSLNNNQTYYYNITSCNERQNCNTSGPYIFRTLENPDTTAPIITDVINHSINNQSAIINWTTDENSNTSVNYGTTTSLGNILGTNNNITSHSISIDSLTNNTLYYYNITSCDSNSNCKTEGPYSFTTLQNPDITAPIISNVINYSITNQSAIVNWTTDENSNTSVNYGTTTSLGNILGTNNNVTSHSISVDSLTNNRLYYYNVTSCDSNSNCNTSGPYSFTTLQNIDTTAPIITDVINHSITNQSAIINWTTDENSNTSVNYGTTTSLGNTLDSNNNVTSHSISLTGLSNYTLYYYNVTSCDASGNCITQGLNNFTTLQTPPPDTTPPTITINNPTDGSSLSSGTTSTSIQISTDENSTCKYHETNSSFNFNNEGTLFNTTGAQSHSFTMSGLSDGNSYTLYYKCNDSLNNINTASTSHTFSVSNPTPPPPPPPPPPPGGLNTAPSFLSDPPTQAIVGQQYVYELNVFDMENDPITLSVKQGPEDIIINDSVMYWTPSDKGTFDIILLAKDNMGMQNTQEFSITVDKVNTLPVFDPSQIPYAIVNNEISFMLDVTDADQDNLTFELITKYSGMTLDKNTGMLTWTPDTTGNFNVIFEVNDSEAVLSESFTLRVLTQEQADNEGSSGDDNSGGTGSGNDGSQGTGTDGNYIPSTPQDLRFIPSDHVNTNTVIESITWSRSEDNDNDDLTYYLRFKYNSEQWSDWIDLGQSTSIPLNSVFPKGVFAIEVKAYDSIDYSNIIRDTLIVEDNTPPVLQGDVNFNIGLLDSGEQGLIDITWSQAQDLDNDPITYEIQFKVNDLEWSSWDNIGNTNLIPINSVIPANKYYIKVRAFDSVLYSDEITGLYVVDEQGEQYQNNEVLVDKNTAPIMNSSILFSPGADITDTQYLYNISWQPAYDPDEDTINYFARLKVNDDIWTDWMDFGESTTVPVNSPLPPATYVLMIKAHDGIDDSDYIVNTLTVSGQPDPMFINKRSRDYMDNILKTKKEADKVITQDTISQGQDDKPDKSKDEDKDESKDKKSSVKDKDIECYSDSDCDENLDDRHYCDDQASYIKRYDPECVHAGTTKSMCKTDWQREKVDDCPYGCNNGFCKEQSYTKPITAHTDDKVDDTVSNMDDTISDVDDDQTTPIPSNSAPTMSGKITSSPAKLYTGDIIDYISWPKAYDKDNDNIQYYFSFRYNNYPWSDWGKPLDNNRLDLKASIQEPGTYDVRVKACDNKACSKEIVSSIIIYQKPAKMLDDKLTIKGKVNFQPSSFLSKDTVLKRIYWNKASKEGDITYYLNFKYDNSDWSDDIKIEDENFLEVNSKLDKGFYKVRVKAYDNNIYSNYVYGDVVVR